MKTILQYFEWYLPNDSGHWNRAASDAENLTRLGFSDVWLPPAYKGYMGVEDTGYGVYDLYDLGEFDQKDTVATKYGTKDEYLRAIRCLHDAGIQVLADIVLNHKMGADYLEELNSSKCAHWNRKKILVENKSIKGWTGFTFPGRNGQYSDFCWDHNHFDGIDWNERTRKNAIFLLEGHSWDTKVDTELGNYDYLMGADVDFSNEAVVQELERWGRWYFRTTGIDGVRLDALKHIRYDFYPRWLSRMREYTGRDFFAVGEYWHGDPEKLTAYLDNCGKCMHLFDVPLHYRFVRAAQEGEHFDLRTIFDDTLLTREPWHAVTFVDNHDSQPGQALESWVGKWFRPLAYALILLRREGVPCVFYGDLYGIPHDAIAPVEGLEEMLLLRKAYAHGSQTDYFDHPNVVGWTWDSGLAVVLSNGGDGWKRMYTGRPGQVFADALGGRSEQIIADSDGWADFTVNGRSVSVWIPCNAG